MRLRILILAVFVPPTVMLGQRSPVSTDAPIQVRYADYLNVGESYIYVTNGGANGASLLGPGTGAAGNICVNTYTFAPDEQLVSCCSCLVTPDGLLRLAVNRDLTANTLTRISLTSATIKLISTLAGPGGTGSNCANSAAMVSQATIVPGMIAWGTTPLPLPQGGYGVTATAFSPATLSPPEIASLSSRCAYILGNGSGYGVCGPCPTAGDGCSLAAFCPNLAALAIGLPGSVPIATTGGKAPYSWSVTSGALPPGLALTGGTIAGTPTSLSNYSFTLSVTDSSSPACVVSVGCSHSVSPLDPQCRDFCAAPGATVSVAPAPASGGTPPYNFSAAGLPSSLVMSTTGLISGAVTAAPGSYPYTMTVRDSGAPQQIHTEQCTATISPRPAATCPVLMSRRGPPVEGVPINSVLVPITGGTPPYTCSATGLPTGVQMTPYCTIGGMVPMNSLCVAPTTYNYTITVRDTSVCPAPITIDCSTTVNCDP